jgi:hypothetical protein
MQTGPQLIGWKEFVDFVDWRLPKIKTKIDTGARTSALGVLSYELSDDADGNKTVNIRIAPYRRHPDRVYHIAVPLLKMVIVSNSAGMREQRPLVETTLKLGPVTKRIRLTITNRMGMRFAMILGRKALEGDFVVDVGKKYVLKKSQTNM